MKEIKVEIFGRNTTIDWNYAAEKVISQLSKLKELIGEPVVEDKCSYFPVTFYGYDSHDPFLSSNDVVCWLNKHFDGNALLKHVIIDEKWTEWRNKDLTGEFYRKFTFDQEVQVLVTQHIESKINEINSKWGEVKAEAEREKKARDEERKHLLEGVEWTYTAEEIRDEGGKTTEYLHVIKINGREYKLRERNVFDFGRVINFYPDIVIGVKTNEYYTKKWINAYGWCRDRDLTADEIKAYTIVNKYGPFAKSHIRM